MAISFQTQDITFAFSLVSKTKAWIREIIELEKKKPGQLNFVLMGDEQLIRKNIEFLGHHTYTDIITFDYCEGNEVNGDILISIDRVVENARKFKVEPGVELRRVMIHGVLHLCGYSDKSPAQKLNMRKKEDWALRKF